VSEAPAILLEAVAKRFEHADPGASDSYAVRDLSLAVRAGELVAILGPTGCGKSTTFNLIAGLIRPSSGSVRVMGHDPYDEFDWFRGKIGIVFQSDRLMPWRSALDNVALGLELNRLGREERYAIARAWLARLGLKGHERDFPHALSGGMRQRVGIARAFAIKPAILLCDEPFSGLDAVTGDALRREFAELVRETGCTGIFITHSIEEALQLGRRILVFQRPARIIYEAAPGAASAGMLAQIRADIRRALGGEADA
jgi:NitT/TauT family transport system ATP-binding protein